MNLQTHDRYREILSDFVSALAKEAANASRSDRTFTGTVFAKIIVGIAEAEADLGVIYPKPANVPFQDDAN